MTTSARSANADLLPSRRSLFATAASAGAFALPALSAHAALARCAIADQDAELLDLERQWRAASVMAQAEDRKRDEISGRYDASMPTEPDEIVWREEDAELFGDAFRVRAELLHGKLTGRRFIDGYRTTETLQAALVELRGLGFPQSGSATVKRGIARIEEILEAHAAWRAETQTCWHSSGMHAAERAYDAASDRVADLRRRIANETAVSLAGVAVKVRVALECFGSTDEMETGIRELLDVDERGSRETMAYSVLRDLVRLQASGNAMGGAFA